MGEGTSSKEDLEGKDDSGGVSWRSSIVYPLSRMINLARTRIVLIRSPDPCWPFQLGRASAAHLSCEVIAVSVDIAFRLCMLLGNPSIHLSSEAEEVDESAEIAKLTATG